MNFKNITRPAENKIIIFAGLVFIAVFWLAVDSKNQPMQKSPVPADLNLVKSHLTALTQTPEFRKHKNTDQLNAVADYIKHSFSKYADSTVFQEYNVEGKSSEPEILSINSAINSKNPIR